jgi:hypothetical protein
MDKFFEILRKTLVATTALVFAFAVTYIPQHYNQIQKADAQFGGPVTVVGGPGSIADIGTAANTSITAAKETSLDQIGFLLAKTMLSQMLQSMVTWINSGFQGSPAFIQDIERFLLDVADETAGEYIESLGGIGSFICEPFRIDIQIALAIRYQKARENRRDSCTLSGIVDNVENFFDGKVRGNNFWRQWIQVTSRPETYTPYGQFMAAEAELNQRIRNSQGQQLKIADWGDGFLSNEICEAIEGPGGGDQNCVISTPGRVISEQINGALGAGRDQLVAADEINEVISALLSQIANQALMGAAGLLGLSSGSGYTSGGYGAGSYVDELASRADREAGSSLAESYEAVQNKLEVQQEYQALAVEYIPKLLGVINNPRAAEELKARAEISRDDAIDVVDATQDHIAYLQPLITDFQTLQRELSVTGISEERTRAIIAEQTQVINKALSYSAYTTYRLRASEREWSDITGS